MLFFFLSRDDSRSPTAFLMELEDSKTSDTLTMTPAGAHQRQPPTESLAQESTENLGFSDFGALDTGRRGHPGLGTLPRRDLGSIPNLGSIDAGAPLGARRDLGSIPNLGSIDSGAPLGTRRDLGSIPKVRNYSSLFSNKIFITDELCHTP